MGKNNTVGHGWLVVFTDKQDNQRYIEYPYKEAMLEHLKWVKSETDGNNLFIIPPGEKIKAEEYLKDNRE